MEGIELLIHELGIHSTYHGYRYLQYAVSLALQDEDYLLAITKSMYPAIAERFHESVSSIERNIRTVITVCWERGNKKLLKQMTPYPLLDKPTTGEFLDILVTYCKQKGMRR